MVIFRIALITTILFVITACQQPPYYVKRRPYLSPTTRGVITGAAGGAALGSFSLVGAPAGALIGGMAGSAIGNNVSANQVEIVKTREMLAHRGVRVFSIGEDVKLVIPSDTLFYYNSPRLSKDGYDTLEMVSTFLHFYKKDLVKVSAFTSNRGLMQRNYALSRGQAENVVDFLSYKKNDTRLFVAEGHGESRPIAANDKGAYNLNRRVEVSFRAIPLPNS